MSRSEMLAEHVLIREIHDLERHLREFAGNQPSSGRSGVRSYVAQTEQEWDQDFSIGSDSDVGVTNFVQFDVTFTGDGSQRFPVENVFADLRVNGTGGGSRPTLGPDGVFRWSDGSRSVQVVSWAVRDKALLTSDLQHRWRFSLQTLKEVRLRFKATVAGSSPGTLSVVRVS